MEKAGKEVWNDNWMCLEVINNSSFPYKVRVYGIVLIVVWKA